MAVQHTNHLRGTSEPVAWQHWAIIGLAGILFLSPFILQYGVGPQTYTAATSSMPDPGVKGLAGENNYFDPAMIAPVMGIILGALGALNIMRISASQEWLIPVFGVWLALAPWLLGFASIARLASATWTFALIGLLVLAISASVHPLLQGREERG